MISIKQLVIYKVAFALLGFSAIVTEIATLAERGTFNAVNFLSYFTILSNILAVVVFLLSALATTAGIKNANLSLLRGAATLYMVMTGIIFSVLLSGLDSAVLTAVAWDNTVLHYIMPVAVLLDWIIDRPKKKLVLSKSLVWIVFPLVYVIYSLVRGSMVSWYPYPFLNPNLKGYGAVLAVSGAITIMVLGIVWVLTDSTQKRKV